MDISFLWSFHLIFDNPVPALIIHLFSLQRRREMPLVIY